jgi:glucosylceramidase
VFEIAGNLFSLIITICLYIHGTISLFKGGNMPKGNSRFTLPVSALCVMASVVATMAAQPSDSSFVIVSGKDNYWKVGTISTSTGNATVTVTENEKHQKWHGFAGCFNEAGWDALQVLSESDRNRAISLLFSEEDGMGLTWGRVPIGASDYALQRYSLNETKDDTGMTNFSITRDKQYLIPYIKAALAVKPDLKFWASAWTPPTWMKTGAADAAGYDGGVFRNEPKYLKANALYTAKFIETYKTEGININAVCPQNEPGYTQNYPSCGWGKYRKPDNSAVNGTEFLSTYIATYLAPMLQEHAPQTDIWFGTLSNDVYAKDYWDAARSKAGQIIKGVGLQWNNSSMAPGIESAGYLVIQSEHQCGNYPWLTPRATSVNDANRDNFLADMAPNNHAYGEESWDLIKTWLNSGTNVYSAWNMVLDTKGFNLDESRKWPQNALLAVDRQAKTLQVTPYYYVMRHFSQYVDTGAVRIGANGGDALAFKNPDGSIVTVVFNSGNSQSNIIIDVAGEKRQISVPGRGWASLCVNWPKPTKAIGELAGNQAVGTGFKVICNKNGYRVVLPSQDAGRLELLTLNGQLLESRAISQGSSELLLEKLPSRSGLLLVRVVTGGEAKTAPLFAY